MNQMHELSSVPGDSQPGILPKLCLSAQDQLGHSRHLIYTPELGVDPAHKPNTVVLHPQKNTNSVRVLRCNQYLCKSASSRKKGQQP